MIDLYLKAHFSLIPKFNSRNTRIKLRNLKAIPLRNNLPPATFDIDFFLKCSAPQWKSWEIACPKINFTKNHMLRMESTLNWLTLKPSCKKIITFSVVFLHGMKCTEGRGSTAEDDISAKWTADTVHVIRLVVAFFRLPQALTWTENGDLFRCQSFSNEIVAINILQTIPQTN